MKDYDTPTFRLAVSQFDQAAEAMHLDHNLRERLKQPQRSLVVSVPVRMDDDRVEVFTGYRVQHNDALGPFKGGIRYHPQVDLDEVRALASWMLPIIFSKTVSCGAIVTTGNCSSIRAIGPCFISPAG